MDRNVGGIDRAIRFIVAFMLFMGGAIAPVSTPVRVVMFVFAGLAFITALIRFCPLWPVLGVNTFKGSGGGESGS